MKILKGLLKFNQRKIKKAQPKDFKKEILELNFIKYGNITITR